MRYEEARLSGRAASFLLRLRLWLVPAPRAWQKPVADLSGLSEHQLKDIGLTRRVSLRRSWPRLDP